MIYAACLLYPDLVAQLLRKVAKQQMTSVICKSFFEGNQKKKWSEILVHPLFSEIDEDLHLYDWIARDDDAEAQQKAVQNVYAVFLERSSILFQADPTLLWLKQTIGFLLNAIDEGRVDQVEFISKIISLVDEPPFYLDRYQKLKIADFTDDVTTINPGDLLGGPELP
jgi:hypothetical protein